MSRPESSSPPTRAKLAPPSAERYTPTPAYESELVFPSPVPTQTEWSAGSTATAPIERLGWESKTGAKCWPASVDLHTPPSAAPAQTVRPSTASAVMRPVTRPEPPPELDQLGSRYRGSSESYAAFVSSVQAPAGTERACAR